MNQFLNLVISGLVTGAIYSIMASGIVLTYQTSGIFNFSHGAVAFVCAYVYYQLHVGNNMPIVPALILSVFVFAPLLGLLLDKVLLRSLAKAPIYARIIGTIGLLVALPAMAQWLVEAVGNGLAGTDLPLGVATVSGGRHRARSGTQPVARVPVGVGGPAQRQPEQRPAGGVRRRRPRRVPPVVRDPAHPRRARDARQRRPQLVGDVAGSQHRALVGGGVGDDDAARRPRWRPHRPAVPAQRQHLHARRVRLARRGRAQRVCGRSRSPSPAGWPSA